MYAVFIREAYLYRVHISAHCINRMTAIGLIQS